MVVGENVPRAVGRSVYLELSARMQMQAMTLAGPDGKIVYLDEAEVRASVPVQDYNRAWPLWRENALKDFDLSVSAPPLGPFETGA